MDANGNTAVPDDLEVGLELEERISHGSRASKDISTDEENLGKGGVGVRSNSKTTVDEDSWNNDTDLVFMTAGPEDELQDEKLLNTLGKKQDVKRTHTFWTLFGLTTCAMSSWVGLLSGSTALDNGGTPGFIWGFLLCWVGGLATAASLAELASIAPVSAGQYHWVWMLAPPKQKKFLSWFTGWLTFAGWTGNAAATALFFGQLVLAIIQVNHRYYSPDDFEYAWHTTLMGLGCLTLAFIVNTAFIKMLPKLGIVLIFFQVVVIIALCIPMFIMADHNTAGYVFAGLRNNAGWSPNGMAFMIGLSSANVALIGVDVPTHFAEETKNAAIAVPRAMFWSFFASGIVGFASAIGYSFVLTNLEDAESSVTGFAVIWVMNHATGSAGSTALICVWAILMFLSTVIFLASASRQLRGFTRDLGIPGSPWLKQLTNIGGLPTPLRCITLSAVIALVFHLVNLASNTVFVALTSITIGGLGLSFIIPIFLILSKRLMPVQGEGFTWGRWTMSLFGYRPTGLGVFMNTFALLSLITNTFFSFFPYRLPVTWDSLNWSAPAMGIMMLIGIAYWFAVGRRVYRGVVHEHDVFAVPVAILY